MCVECLEDRGDIKKQMHLIRNTYAVSHQPTLSLFEQQLPEAAPHKPGGDIKSFSVLLGVILATCCVKTTISKG